MDLITFIAFMDLITFIAFMAFILIRFSTAKCSRGIADPRTSVKQCRTQIREPQDKGRKAHKNANTRVPEAHTCRVTRHQEMAQAKPSFTKDAKETNSNTNA